MDLGLHGGPNRDSLRSDQIRGLKTPFRMSSFYTTFIEVMVDIGIPRDRAQYLSELLRSEIDARHSLVAQFAAAEREVAEREVAELKLQTKQILAESEERIAQSNERIAQSDKRIAQSDEHIAKLIKARESGVATDQ